MSGGSPALTAMVDSMLVDVPGWFVASNIWWTEQLDRLERHVLTEENTRTAAVSG